MSSLSRAVPMAVGAAVVNLLSGGMWLPASRAAWSWGCTAYLTGKSDEPLYVEPGVTAPCGTTCDCGADPCAGANAAVPSNITSCIGAGDDASTDGCFKLHMTYGTSPAALAAVAVRGVGTLTDACGAASVLKVYGNSDGIDLMKTWGALTEAQADGSGAPANAKECQQKCAEHSECKYFTFNDQSLSGGNYGYFRGLCFLLDELSCDGTAYGHHHGAISGPKTCPSPPDSDVSAASGRGGMAAVAVSAGLAATVLAA